MIPSPAAAPLFGKIREAVVARRQAGAADLDRDLFAGDLSLTGLVVADPRSISAVRKTLEKGGALFPSPLSDLSIKSLIDAGDGGEKAFLLAPAITADERSQPECVRALVASGNILAPFSVPVTYANWSYLAVLSALLPADDLAGEVPTGFSIIGHIAHLNLRDQFLPYKHAIAAAVVDKNPAVTTVINKVDSVGAADEFRTFAYEVLAGDGNTAVEVAEQGCLFSFDYATVYWNSRLSTEHTRLVARMRPGEAVCDVMAGVGPFAVPAGKKGVFVRANDLNPHSYAALAAAVTRNKVSQYVGTTNSDGRDFIKSAVQQLLAEPRTVDVLSKPKYVFDTALGKKVPGPRELVRTDKEPSVFSHFVMNLPAIAIEFLPHYIGLYAPSASRKLTVAEEELRKTKMPLVHVYTFGPKANDNRPVAEDLCKHASELLGSTITLRRLASNADPLDSTSWDKLEDGEAEVQDVRDVAPKKRMFCLTLRLPAEVAFRTEA